MSRSAGHSARGRGHRRRRPRHLPRTLPGIPAPSALKRASAAAAAASAASAVARSGAAPGDGPTAPGAPGAPAAPARSGSGPGAGRERLGRATVTMAGGTLASRVTGLLRIIVAAYALGYSGLSDAFNLANNTPNIVHDLVLGGILSATFVPLFVHRLATRSEKEATDSISAVLTLAFTVLVAATVAFFLLAPLIIDLYTIGSHAPNIELERQVATELLRWFSPQLLAYGAISLMTALLSTARRFALPTFVPLINNIVAIVVLLEFAAIGHTHTLAGVQHQQGLIVLLGLGTTLGVVLQALALVPAARSCGIAVHWLWRPRDSAVREIAHLSSWTFGFVLANQVAVFVISALAVHISQGTFTAYTYAFTFFQLPFGMVAVSVMSAVTPALSDRFTQGDAEGFAYHFGLGLRRLIAGVVPAAVGYLILAQPLMQLLLGHGAAQASVGVRLTASLLVLFALGLPGYCIYLYAIRAFQAGRDTKTPFYLYLVENGLNVALAFALIPVMGARALALSLSIAYTVAAAAALVVLRLRTGGLGGRSVLRYSLRTIVLSLAMAFVVAVAVVAIGSGHGSGLWLRVVGSVVIGVAFYALGAGLAGTFAGWQTQQRGRSGTRRGSNARDPDRHR